MSTPVMQEAMDTELREIRQLLQDRQRFLRLSPPLEKAFRRHAQQRVLDVLVRSKWGILSLYLLVGLITYAEIRELSYPFFLLGNLQVWWTAYLVEAVVVAGLVLLSGFSLLQRYYTVCAGALAAIALATLVIATSAFPDPYFNQYASYGVIFVLALVYGMGALGLGMTILVCGGATLISWLVIRQFGLWLDWGMFGQYAVVANLAGILICYVLEQRDRQMFLQARLLELEKGKLDSFSHELSRLSREDALTGLANRRHFNEIFQTEWDRARREQQPLALIFVDIDHFKPFNDVHGHLEGDGALSEVGLTLKGALHRPGDLAARYGGEEFILLLPSTPLDGALEVALQVRAAIEALGIPHKASTVANHLIASVGVAAMVPTPEFRSSQLLARADEAVYAAKAAGRNCVMVAEAHGFVAA